MTGIAVSVTIPTAIVCGSSLIALGYPSDGRVVLLATLAMILVLLFYGRKAP